MDKNEDTLALQRQLLNETILAADFDLSNPAVLAASMDYDRLTNEWMGING